MDPLDSLATFANCAVTAQQEPEGLLEFRGVFDDQVETVSPYELDRVELKPQLTALSSNILLLARVSVFEILRDGEAEAKRYSFDGKPRPDGSGLTLAILAAKK